MCPLIVFGFGYRIVMHRYDETQVDYSKYLGPRWRENKFQGKRVSTVVANHISFIEVLLWMSQMTPPAFTPASFVKKFPVGDHYCRALQSIYIDRISSTEELDRQVADVAKRQELIERDDLEWGPLLIFAEGSVTNGKNLSRFRRGAFAAGLPVKPVFHRYYWKNVSPEYSTLKGLDLSLIMISEFAMNQVHGHELPTFVPNEYLYTEYAKTLPGHEKMQKWEIYAHAVEDLIRSQGGFGKNEQPLREKISFQEFIWGLKEEITVNGKTFYWPPRGQTAATTESKKHS